MRFEQMGYGQTNFILNAGTSFWLLIFWVFLAIISIIATFNNSLGDKFYRFRSWLNNLVFFDLLIRIYLETYLELLVCSLINIKHTNMSYSGERLSTIISVVFLIALTASPQVIHFLITRNLGKILNKDN